MENVAKALEMAAGVMLGVILMALVAYFFTTISTWPQNEDDLMSAEQLSKFNLEYTVYQKSKMYGVDVISCLNKVISNNEKYAQGGAFLGGNASLGDYKQRENFWINVKIRLGKTPGTTETKLKESIKTMYINDSNKEVERYGAEAGITLSRTDSGLESLNEAIGRINPYTKLGEPSGILDFSYNQEAEVDVFSNADAAYRTGGYISLTYVKGDGNISDMNEDLTNLLHRVQTLSSGGLTSNFTYTIRNRTKNNFRKWTQIVWETVLTDLKGRKFTCKDLTYNTTTGRVNEIIFEEI